MRNGHFEVSKLPIIGTIFPVAIMTLIANPFDPSFYILFLTIYICLSFEQQRRPIILALRRFGDVRSRGALMHLSGGITTFSRVIWLMDLSTSGEMPGRFTGTNRNIQSFSGIVWYISIIGFFIWSIIQQSDPAGILFAFYVLLAGIVWLITIAGQPGALVQEFYLSIGLCFLIEPFLNFLGVVIMNDWLIFTIKITFFLIFFICLHKYVNFLVGRYPDLFFRFFRRFFFSNLVESNKDISRLRNESTKGFQIWPKYLSNMPVLVNDVLCSNKYWKDAVHILLRSPLTALAIVDVTYIERDVGIEWEIRECDRNETPMFFICDELAIDISQYLLSNMRGVDTKVHGYSIKKDKYDIIEDTSGDIINKELISFIEHHYPGAWWTK